MYNGCCFFHRYILVGSIALGFGLILTILAIFLSVSWASLGSTVSENSVNSFYPWRFGCDLKDSIFNFVSLIGIFRCHRTLLVRSNIGSGNDLVPEGNKPWLEPMLYPVLCHHMASLGPQNRVTSHAGWNVSFHLDYLFKNLSRVPINTSKFCIARLCAENPSVTGEFPAQWASNAEVCPWHCISMTVQIHSQSFTWVSGFTPIFLCYRRCACQSGRRTGLFW